MVRNVGIGLLLTCQACWLPFDNETTLELGEVFFDRVEIRVDRINVEVTRGDAAGAVLEARALTDTQPTASSAIHGTTLVIEAECEKPRPRCSGDLKLALPDNVEVLIDGTRTDVSVQEWFGELDVHIDRGDLDLTTWQGVGNATLTRGDIEMDDLAGTLDLTMDQSDVEATRLGLSHFTLRGERLEAELEFVFRPDTVFADFPTGEMQLRVPSGAYFLSLKGKDDKVGVRGVTHDPASTARIDVNTVNGDVLIDGVLLDSGGF